MLEYLRNASNRPVAKVLMGLLIFSFVGWGAADWILGNTRRDANVAVVGGTEISANAFNTEKSRAMARMPRDQQKQIYTDGAAADRFYGRVLADLINNAMIENRAHDLGFVVTDKWIAAEIRSFPEFQENKQFSPAKFYYTLANSGFTEKQFADYLRAQTLRSMTLGAMSMPVRVPEFALRASYNARYGMREIDVATIKFSDFKALSPTDAQLREFYAKNPKMIPEYRTVSYVLVPTKMDKPDTYETGLKRAQKLEDLIISGESMKYAAAKIGTQFVMLSAFAKDARPNDSMMSDSMVAKVFAMDAGMESEIIETKSGFAIIRVEKIAPSKMAEFDSVKSGLIPAWQREEQKKQAYVSANEVLVNANKGGAIANAKAAAVSRISGAAPDVLVAAFKQSVGTNVIVAASDAFYVLRAKREIAPALDTAKMTALRRELQNMSSREIMEDYNAFLMREYPLKINKKTLEKMAIK